MRALLVLFVGLFCLAPLSAQKVGFIDIERVLEDHRDVKKAREDAGRERDERMERLRQRAEELRTLDNDLSLLKAGSPQWLEQKKRIQVDAATLELDRRLVVIEYNLMLIEKVQAIYAQTLKVVEEVAKKRGYEAVSVYSSRKIEGRSYPEFKRALGMQAFIWHELSHDLTEDVLQRVR